MTEPLASPAFALEYKSFGRASVEVITHYGAISISIKAGIIG